MSDANRTAGQLRGEALERWALDLIAPVEGARRRAFASYRAIVAAVGPEIVHQLDEAGLIEIWTLGPRTLTPWGFESGKLVTLSPLGAQTRALRLDERPELAVVAHRVKRRAVEEIQTGAAGVPFWEMAAKPPRRPPRAPARFAGDWVELVAEAAHSDEGEF
jgi:hypothetical protein